MRFIKMKQRDFFSVYLTLITIAILVVSSCNPKRTTSPSELNNPYPNIITLARRVTIQKTDGSVVLTILNPWQGASGISHVYNLVKRGDPIPPDLDSSEIIFVPLKKIICMSTTHLGMIVALGEINSVKAVSGTGFIYSDNLLKKVDNGEIEDVGYDGNLNNELIIRIDPDLIMMYGVGGESAGYVGKLKELGVKVLFNGDYLENDPLSKAEWIKVFGALYCKEELADRIFNSEKESYDSIRSYIAENIQIKPKVMLGLPYKDTWYISPGNSFISRLIEDAGGDYIWKDTESEVSMPFGIENVYLKALTADYWLNTGAAKTKNEISSVDRRLEDLPCFRQGRLYNNNKRLTIKGGNDYWESGSVYPHVILKDIASILHPELFPHYQQVYYRNIK
jgi:iron complex transport system substrate-binding protein